MDINDFVSKADGAEDYKRVMAEAKERARIVREEWTASVARGEQSFDALMDLVNTPGSKDAKYASKIKLYDILRAAKGWDEERAYKALTTNGMDNKTTVGDARLSIPAYTRFRSLIGMDGSEWEPTPERSVLRPEMPAGWPWMAKLDGIIALDGAASYPLPEPRETPSRVHETAQEAPVKAAEDPTPEPVAETPQAPYEEPVSKDDYNPMYDFIDHSKDALAEDDAEDEFSSAMRAVLGGADDEADNDDNLSDDLARILGIE